MSPHDLAQRFDALRSLFQLAQRQREALQREEIERFLALLEEREPLIEECAGFAASMQLEPENVIPFPGTAAPAGKATEQSDDMIAMESLYRAIIEIDTENERMLRHGLDELQQAAKDLERVRITARGYRPVVAAILSAVDERC